MPDVPAAGASDLDRPLGRRGWAVVAICILATSFPLLHEALRAPPPATVAGMSFHDDFDRREIGGDWFTTGMHWRILNGEL